MLAALLIVALFIVLDLTALRWSFDSRDSRVSLFNSHRELEEYTL